MYDIEKVEILSCAEAANALRIGYLTFRKMVKAGTGPKMVKIGNRDFVTRQALNDWLLSRVRGGDSTNISTGVEE